MEQRSLGGELQHDMTGPSHLVPGQVSQPEPHQQPEGTGGWACSAQLRLPGRDSCCLQGTSVVMSSTEGILLISLPFMPRGQCGARLVQSTRRPCWPPLGSSLWSSDSGPGLHPGLVELPELLGTVNVLQQVELGPLPCARAFSAHWATFFSMRPPNRSPTWGSAWATSSSAHSAPQSGSAPCLSGQPQSTPPAPHVLGQHLFLVQLHGEAQRGEGWAGVLVVVHSCSRAEQVMPKAVVEA